MVLNAASRQIRQATDFTLAKTGFN